MSVDLKVDWCSYQAAKWAVEHWHYSRRMPRSKMMTVGVWENDAFIGTVIFSYGATPQIGSPYNLSQFQVCELTRIAMRSHEVPVSRSVAAAVKLLKTKAPGLRLIVSFADTEQNHFGIIYQAGNWVYTGETKSGRVGFIVHGKKVHTRTIGLKPGGIQSLDWVRSNLDRNAGVWNGEPKHRYLYPLDRAMRKQIAPLALPYPKRETCGPSVEGDTPSQTESSVRSAGAAPETVTTV